MASGTKPSAARFFCRADNMGCRGAPKKLRPVRWADRPVQVVFDDLCGATAGLVLEGRLVLESNSLDGLIVRDAGQNSSPSEVPAGLNRLADCRTPNLVRSEFSLQDHMALPDESRQIDAVSISLVGGVGAIGCLVVLVRAPRASPMIIPSAEFARTPGRRGKRRG